MSRNDKDTYQLIHVPTATTEKAWAVAENEGNDARVFWLPKSQADRGVLIKTLRGGEELYEYDVPEWLAEQEDLI
jgi:hypothetical protein